MFFVLKQTLTTVYQRELNKQMLLMSTTASELANTIYLSIQPDTDPKVLNGCDCEYVMFILRELKISIYWTGSKRNIESCQDAMGVICIFVPPGARPKWAND